MKASNGSSDESESQSDFLLEGLSGAGMYSSWGCCCSSSSSKYLTQTQANSQAKWYNDCVSREEWWAHYHLLLFGFRSFLGHSPCSGDRRMVYGIQSGVALLAESAVCRRRYGYWPRRWRWRRPATGVERKRYFVVHPVVLHGVVRRVHLITITGPTRFGHDCLLLYGWIGVKDL